MKSSEAETKRNGTGFTRDNVWIISQWISVDTCCLCAHPVRTGCKYIYVIFQDIPSDHISLTACKTGHNCLKITCNIYQISCLCNSGAVQAVSSTCFTDSHNRRVIFIFMSEITDYGTC